MAAIPGGVQRAEGWLLATRYLIHLPCGGAEKRAQSAGVAQLVEQLICNQQVVGSNPIASSDPANVCGVWFPY